MLESAILAESAFEGSSLAGIDYVIVVTYMLGVLVIGSYFGKYVRSAGDFFLAGKALPFWAIGMSIVVSDIGAIDFVSGAGGAYRYGIAQANFDWIGSLPAAAIAALVFIPYYWRAGVYTIPEFLGKRYNSAVQIIEAVLWLGFLISMLGVMLWVTAVMMNTVLGWSTQQSIWTTVIIVGIYTVSGGLAAVVMTDVIQMVVMFVGAGALLILTFGRAGGWSGVVNRVSEIATVQAAEKARAVEQFGVFERLKDVGIDPNAVIDPNLVVDPSTIVECSHHFTLLLPHSDPTPYPWTGIVFGLGIVLSTAYFVGNQAVVQRTLGARSEWDAKAGMLFAGLLKLFIPILVMIPGLAAFALYPPAPKVDPAVTEAMRSAITKVESGAPAPRATSTAATAPTTTSASLKAADNQLDDPDKAVPMLVRDILPAGLKGLMFAAFFAALMSSVDSYLNSCSTMFMSDVYGKIYHATQGQALPPRHGLVVGRALTAILIVAAGLFAPFIERFETIYVGIQTMLSFIQGPTLAVLLLGILWRRTTGWGALVGLVSGVCLTVSLTAMGEEVFPSDDPFLFISFWSFLFSLVVTFVVSLLTPAEPEEKTRGLVFAQVMHDEAAQAALKDRVNGS